jgi:hypothetical protein
MFLSRLNDPHYCVAEAEKTRIYAEMKRDSRSKESLLKIADGYLHLARRAEVRRNRGTDKLVGPLYSISPLV